MRLDLSDLPGVVEITIVFPGGNEMVIDVATQTARLPAAGEHRPAGAVRACEVGGLAAEFIAHLRVAEDLKPETLDGYRRRLGQFARWLAETGCDPVSPATWTAYYATLKERGLSPYTRKGHYDRLRRFARWLVETGRLTGDPMSGIRAPGLPKKRLPKAIPREAIRAMLKAATEPRDRALLLLLRDSGGRAMEVMGVTWGAVDFDERRIAVTGKGDKGRYLRFKPVTAKALEVYRETAPHEPADPVWWGLKGPLTTWGLRHLLKRLAASAGVDEEHVNPHAWRHAFGRDTTKAGIPTAQLQDLMGHGNIQVTTIYTQFDEADLDEAHDRYSPVDGDLLDAGDMVQ